MTTQPMQLSLFNDLNILEQEGFTVIKTFESSNNDKFKLLECMHSIILNERIVLYVRDNENGTFNTYGFRHESYNVSLEEVIQIAKNKTFLESIGME